MSLNGWADLADARGKPLLQPDRPEDGSALTAAASAVVERFHAQQADSVSPEEKVDALLGWVALLQQTAANHVSQMDAIAAEMDAAAQVGALMAVGGFGSADEGELAEVEAVDVRSRTEVLLEAKVAHADAEQKIGELLGLVALLRKEPLQRSELYDLAAQMREAEAARAWQARKLAEEAEALRSLKASHHAMLNANERAHIQMQAVLMQTQATLEKETEEKQLSQSILENERNSERRRKIAAIISSLQLVSQTRALNTWKAWAAKRISLARLLERGLDRREHAQSRCAFDDWVTVGVQDSKAKRALHLRAAQHMISAVSARALEAWAGWHGQSVARRARLLERAISLMQNRLVVSGLSRWRVALGEAKQLRADVQ